MAALTPARRQAARVRLTQAPEPKETAMPTTMTIYEGAVTPDLTAIHMLPQRWLAVDQGKR
jgi:hypothetical protein